MSQGGAAYFAGKGVSNTNQEASIAGAVAAAHFIRSIAPIYGVPVVLHTDHCAKKLLPWLDGMLDADEAFHKENGTPLFSSHMIDLSEEPRDWNIETTAKYLKRAAPMKQWLEMEIGLTGGEEDVSITLAGSAGRSSLLAGGEVGSIVLQSIAKLT